MKTPEKFTKTECVLLALTLIFLLCAGAVWGLRHDRDDGAVYAIRTEGVVPVAPEDGSTDEELPPSIEPPTAEHPLDLNTAVAEELALLPGIGPVLAERIAAYREEHGPFGAKEDVMDVEGIGEGIYEKIEERITVKEGAS